MQSSDYLLRYKALLAVHGLTDVPSRQGSKLSLLMKYHSRLAISLFTISGRRYISRVGLMAIPQDPSLVPTGHWRLSLAFGGTISFTIIKPLLGVIDVFDISPFPDRCSVNHWTVPMVFFPGHKTWAVSVDTTQDLLLVARGDRGAQTGW